MPPSSPPGRPARPRTARPGPTQPAAAPQRSSPRIRRAMTDGDPDGTADLQGPHRGPHLTRAGHPPAGLDHRADSPPAQQGHQTAPRQGTSRSKSGLSSARPPASRQSLPPTGQPPLSSRPSKFHQAGATRPCIPTSSPPNTARASAVRGDLRLLLNAPGAGGGGRAGDDATSKPGGWNRFHLTESDLDTTVERLRDVGGHLRSGVVDGQGGRQALVAGHRIAYRGQGWGRPLVLVLGTRRSSAP